MTADKRQEASAPCEFNKTEIKKTSVPNQGMLLHEQPISAALIIVPLTAIKTISASYNKPPISLL